MAELNWYDYVARMLTMDIPGFTSQDPKSENSYSESPYIYVSNNPLKYIDPDGREKLNGMGPKDNGDKKIARRQFDNDMINIYSHGSLHGFGYYVGNGEIKVRDYEDFKNFLSEHSKIWQTRQRGETIYIMLHACHNGEDYKDDVDGKIRNFAREMSRLLSDENNRIIIGAPTTTIKLNSYFEEVRNSETHEPGFWNFYREGELMYTKEGKNGNSPALMIYNRKKIDSQNMVENNQGNSDTDKEKNGREARGKAQKSWGTVRRSFYERFNF